MCRLPGLCTTPTSEVPLPIYFVGLSKRAYHTITVDGKTFEVEVGLHIVAPPAVKINGRVLRTLADHIEYVGSLSASKLWVATAASNGPSTQQLLESFTQSSVNAAQSTSKKNNRNFTNGRPWGVQRKWEGRAKGKTLGSSDADAKYTKCREKALASKDGEPKWSKNKWAIPDPTIFVQPRNSLQELSRVI